MKKKQVKFDFEVPVYLTFIIPELLPWLWVNDGFIGLWVLSQVLVYAGHQ